ncbi:paired amphipathic helix protein Sin3-like 3 [Papaver somniferum]|uniref:paired amphipathic helix protein Sin3-like 3 n=1 Tax=Papaver somniferum TaxID=3469 RepID=UPI000E6F9DDF|nr:paired amphipathic helix protein Sin3-like 3 [Papaver somniferum]
MKMKRPREEDYFAYVKAVQKTPKYNEFLRLMKQYKSSATYDTTNLDFVTTRIKEIFRDHSNLIHGFNVIFLPEEHAIENDFCAEQQNRVLKSTKRVEAEDLNNKFFEKVMRKEKFTNPDDCKKYLKCLYLYSKKRISEGDLKDMVGGLRQYGCVTISRTAKKDNVDQEIQDPQKDERETGFEVPVSKRTKLEEESMIDRLLNCETDNPSYQLATERILTSGWTELGVAVLNDTLVSTESSCAGGDTCHFKKNAYEKNLFRFEDNRCERDRQFELVKGTVECVEGLLQKIVEKTINAQSIHFEDHFKVLQLGCIKRLCSESWQDVVDALGKDAQAVLPGILTRLQKKLKEVTSRLSVTYIKKMKAVYAKNFRKSLDYGNSSSGEQEDISSSSKDEDVSTSACPDLLAEPTT